MTAQEAREAIIAELQLPFETARCTLLRLQVAEAVSSAHKELVEARGRALIPKDVQFTELDRKTMLDGFCAEYEESYQSLVAFNEILSDYYRSTARTY